MPAENLIDANDPRIGWSGAVSLEPTSDGVMPWRIPFAEKTLYHDELVVRAAHPAGIRLRFRTNSDSVRLQSSVSDERGNVDLVLNGALSATATTQGRADASFDNIGTDWKTCELWLPQFGEFPVNGIEIDAGAELAAAPAESGKRWITYGSSITQCRLADSPTLTWPAIVARTRSYDLTCLGFGGQCHLDPLVARVIRDSEADLISMCLGINIYGAASLGARTFQSGILGFVKIVREKHPETPIVLMSPIYSPGRETTPNAVGFTLEAMRLEVAEAVKKMKAHGDSNISYIDGLDIFDSSNAHLLPDDLHPNSKGYGLMAENLLSLLPQV